MGSTKVAAPEKPDPGQTYGDVLQSQIALAPQMYAASAQYDPMYAQLYGGIARDSLLGTNGVLDTQIEASKRIQEAQSGLQNQQFQNNLSNLQQFGGQAVDALRSANPNIAAANDNIRGLMNSFDAGMGQIGAAQSAGASAGPASLMQAASAGPASLSQAAQAQAFQAQAGPLVRNQRIGAAQAQGPMMVNGQAQIRDVQAQSDPTLGQANSVVQQMLASGGRISDQESNSIANKTLSYFNTMGRAQDPAAAAKLALNLDSAQQARMNNAINLSGQVINANQGANAQNLAAQQSNQGADLSQAGYGLQANLANQQALLGNNQFNASMLQNANLANQQANLQSQLYNSGMLSDLSKYNASNLQNNSQYNASNLQQNNQYNSGAINAQNQYNAGLLQQANASNQSAINQQNQYNAGLSLQNNQYNANLAQQANMYNSDDRYRAMQTAQGLIGQSFSQEQAVTNPAIGMVMNPSNAMNYAGSMYGQGQMNPLSSQGFGDVYNQANQLYGQYYGAQQGAAQANAKNNSSMWGGIAGLAGALGGAAIIA